MIRAVRRSAPLSFTQRLQRIPVVELPVSTKHFTFPATLIIGKPPHSATMLFNTMRLPLWTHSPHSLSCALLSPVAFRSPTLLPLLPLLAVRSPGSLLTSSASDVPDDPVNSDGDLFLLHILCAFTSIGSSLVSRRLLMYGHCLAICPSVPHSKHLVRGHWATRCPVFPHP